MGGSGVLNFMMWVRGNPDDWNILNNQNVTGWDYKSVLPYFKKIENVLSLKNGINKDERGTNGPITVRESYDLKPSALFQDSIIKSANKHGIPFTNDVNAGYQQNPGIGYTQYNVDINGRRGNSFISYMKNVVAKDKKNNLHILPKAHVTKILFESKKVNGKHIGIGAEFIDLITNKTHSVKLSSKQKG